MISIVLRGSNLFTFPPLWFGLIGPWPLSLLLLFSARDMVIRADGGQTWARGLK